MEDQNVTEDERAKHIEKEHVVAFDTFEQRAGFVEGKPILNTIGLITKTRNGVTKPRTNLDTEQSRVKMVAANAGRATLRRLFGAILRLFCLLAMATSADNSSECLVCDFSDAYWQIPLRGDERKYFCATAKIKSKRKCMAFLRSAQGSTNAGLLWGRLAALVMRLSQSPYSPSELSLICYVHDPLAALHGITAVSRRNAAFMVLVWEALGFKLAYSRGQLGEEATWIGGTIRTEAVGIRACIKEALVSDIKTDLERFIDSSVISLKDLHSLVGKLGHAAGLLIIMRPFLEPLWAALYANNIGCAPPNTLWTNQIISTLRWFKAFFGPGGTKVERFFRLDAYSRTGTIVEMGTDASPWGIGGWLSVNGKTTHFFSCRLTTYDAVIFDMTLGTADGWQLWECLAVLVAVDIWTSLWSHHRVVLKVRGDNVGALTLLVKMRPAITKTDIIARELALRVVELSFPPGSVHTPGVAHVVADKRSRVFAPGRSGRVDNKIDPGLEHAAETKAPSRNKAWYRVLE